MDWLKNNWFKVGILALGAIVVFSMLNKPARVSENTEEESTSKDRQCFISGQQWLEDFKKLHYYDDDGAGYIDAEYNYNESSNRCYTRVVMSDGSARGYVRHYLYDVYNNSEVYSSFIRLEPDDANRTNKRIHQSGLEEEEFFDKSDLLMSVREP